MIFSSLSIVWLVICFSLAMSELRGYNMIPQTNTTNSGNRDLGASGSVIITTTNSASSNELVVVALSGSSAPYTFTVAQYSTGGKGSSFIENQGSVIVNGNFVFAVNPGSNTVASFVIQSDLTLVRQSLISSGGSLPASVAAYGSLLVVLNQNSGSLRSYVINSDGTLTTTSAPVFSIPSASQAAQVSFMPGGQILIVASIDFGLHALSITSAGVIASIDNIASSAGAFGFDINPDGTIVVSEVYSGTVSSYRLVNNKLVLLTNRLASGSAACWTQISADGNTAYVTNTGASTITAYTISSSGFLTRIQTVSTPFPRDVTITLDGSSLIAVRSNAIYLFAIASNGQLTTQQTINTGIFFSANGAAFGPSPNLNQATFRPSSAPTIAPTARITSSPTIGNPSSSPTIVPTPSPTIGNPSSSPTVVPTSSPTIVPTSSPTPIRTSAPTTIPTSVITSSPSSFPSVFPTAAQTNSSVDSLSNSGNSGIFLSASDILLIEIVAPIGGALLLGLSYCAFYNSGYKLIGS